MVVTTRHRLYVTNNVPTLTRNIHDETRVCCLWQIWIFFSARNKQSELSTSCAGDKPFVTVDHPLIAVFIGEGFNERWITACYFRFGHGKTGTHAAFTQWAKIFLFLFWRAPMQQCVLISLIGCLCIQHVWTNAHFCGFS